jgi:hypothetical protein
MASFHEGPSQPLLPPTAPILPIFAARNGGVDNGRNSIGCDGQALDELPDVRLFCLSSARFIVSRESINRAIFPT